LAAITADNKRDATAIDHRTMTNSLEKMGGPDDDPA
jgi:hypothetical protein